MAFFPNINSFIFFTTLSLSLQIHARDSQFFSKVTHANNNGKEINPPNEEEPINKPEQEPIFLPETDNSYGLYGHESRQFPPTTTDKGAGATTNATTYTTTTTYQPYKTESEEDMSKFPNKKYSYYNKDVNNNNNYFNKDTYGENQNELGNTKYTELYNSLSNQKKNNQKYYYSNNGASDRYYYNNIAASNRNNGEREGMSDTRFMEGGKYFYNVGSEKYNPTFYGDSTREPKSKTWENNRDYFGGPNHPLSYENSNAMEGYQNHEFEGNKDDFEP